MISIARDVKDDIHFRAATLGATLDKKSTRTLPGYDAYVSALDRRMALSISKKDAAAEGAHEEHGSPALLESADE